MTHNIVAYIYRSNDCEAKKRSASGAAFYELAIRALSENFYIVGSAWDEHLVARHIVSNNLRDLIRMQGSKYVQSDMGDCYREIISLLKSGNKILFSGTPCQAAAIGILASNIGKRENLISVAIICHGVPSPLVWESYKRWDCEKNKSELVDVNFRNKDKEGYKTTYTKFTYGSGKVVYRPTYLPINKFVESGIVYNLSMRPSCTECKAKGYNENVDIILGDWHSEYSGEGNLGTSCVTCFTEQGAEFVESTLSDLRAIDYSEIVRVNGCIENSSKVNQNRERFFNLIKDYKNWDKVEELYPSKYIIKKILYLTGLYNLIKGKI